MMVLVRGHKINYVTNSIATAIVLLAVVGLGVVALAAILLHEPPETMRSQRMVSTKSQNREHKINVRNLSFKKPVENAPAPVEQVASDSTTGSVGSEAARMIEQGEDLNAPCKFGYLVLHWATSEGDLPTVKLLIEHGADVNASNVDGFTPLMISAQEDKLEIAKLLIEKGADVNAKSEDGKTALDFAREAGHQDIVDLLLAHGAKE